MGARCFRVRSGTVESSQELDLAASESSMKRARSSIASGLASFARYRKNQVVFDKSKGAYLWDIEGNRFIDCVSAHGPILLGHAHEKVTAAIAESVTDGLQFGGPHPAETELAERILSFLPWADKVAYMSTGSEAVHLALRIAKSHTGRRAILKFDGHYHGWIDPVFVNSPQVRPTDPPLGGKAEAENPGNHILAQIPNVEGEQVFDHVLVAPWGDSSAFEAIMKEYGSEIAAVILEPLSTNFGTFLPPAGYLEELVAIVRRCGALTIFDEVVSGFRIAPGGAAELLGVTPDLAVYGKAIASGLPISVVAGTAKAMEVVTTGRVFTVGTFSGTPSAVAAALATLHELGDRGRSLYEHLDGLGQRLKAGLERVGSELRMPVHVNQVGSLLQILIGEIDDPESIDGVNQSDKILVAEICDHMILLGVFMSRKGIIYLNGGHSEDDVEAIIRAFQISATRSATASPLGLTNQAS